ncbi:DUF885 family protein [uncultured Merdimonas sp.]|uniref:DUF885 family protein n=1 Tax=uncultured Merdimonas sp. TaxID=2023269 RepID=UPI003209591F
MTDPKLTQMYRELDRDCACFARRLSGETQGVFVPDPESEAQMRTELAGLRRRQQELKEPDRVYALVRHHMGDFLDAQGFELEEACNHPEKPYLRSFEKIEAISRLSRKPDEERAKDATSLLKELCGKKEIFLKLILERHSEKGRKETASALHKTRSRLEVLDREITGYFPEFAEAQQEMLQNALRQFCEALKEMEEELEKSVGQESESEAEEDFNRTVKMKEKEYRTLLEKRLGVSFEELLAWHREEIEKTRAEVFAIAGSLDISDPAPKTMEEVVGILNLYEGACKSPEEMYRRANTYLKRTRALAHEYVRLPEDESCVCVEAPLSCIDSYPWGGYEGGDFSVRPLRGQMFLNQCNYENISDGWIRLNALHEAYPGHHVQYIRAEVDETPETVKIGAKLVPLLEGTCLRTEKAFAFIYGEDPFFPLFVAYRRHHASVRIYVDLLLFYYGGTIGDAVKVYQEELGFEQGTARRQVEGHLNGPGYFTCYYYGMKKICQWEKEYGYTKKDFTELLFSAGYLSIECFHELAALTKEEQERYFHEFSSLKQTAR